MLAWAQGDFSLPNYYRPLGQAAIFMSAKIVGVHDWSMKFLSACFDVLYALLAFGFLWRISKDLLISASAVLLYLLLPQSIFMSRSEFLHSTQAFFFLGSLWCWWEALRSQRARLRFLFFGAAGFLFAVSFNVHPSIIFAGPGLVIYYFIYEKSAGEKTQILKSRLKGTLADGASFLGGVFLLMSLLAIFFGRRELWQALSTQRDRVYGESFGFLTLLVKIPWDILSQGFSKIFAVLFFSLFFIPILSSKKWSVSLRESFQILSVLGGYILSYILVTATDLVVRITLPFFVIIAFVFFLGLREIVLHGVSFKNFSWTPPRFFSSTFVCYAALAFISAIQFSPIGNPTVGRITFEACFLRKIHDHFVHESEPERKVIFAPSSAYRINEAFLNPLYFSKDSRYLLDLPQKTFYEKFYGSGARYLFLVKSSPWYSASTFQLGDYKARFPLWMKEAYGPEAQTFFSEPRLEINWIEFFLRDKAQKVLSLPEGDLYKVNPPGVTINN